MTTKTYLRQIYWLKIDVENKMREIAEIRSLTYGITACASDSDKVKSSMKGDTIGDSLAKLEKEEEQLNKQIAKYLVTRKTISDQIDSIEDYPTRMVLSMKYVLDMKLENIAVAMNYSYRQTKRYYGRGLNAFEEKYGENYKNL